MEITRREWEEGILDLSRRDEHIYLIWVWLWPTLNHAQGVSSLLFSKDWTSIMKNEGPLGIRPWWQKRKIPLKIFHVQNKKKTILKVPFSFLNLEYSKKWRNWAEQHCHLCGVCNAFAHFTPTTVYLIRKRCPPSPDLAPNSKRWFLMLTISAEWLIKTRF